MEIKDLVLLMLIPIILISIFVYIDKYDLITGLIIYDPIKLKTQQEESNVIGTYSIMPSFKAKIDYDLNDYNKVKEEFNIILSCAQNKDILACIDDINYDNKQFLWALGCDKGAEKVLYELAEFLQDCFDSEDNNCLCKKDLRLSKDDIQNHELTNKQYAITLMQDIQSQKIDIKMLTPADLSYSIKLNDRSVWYPNRYILTYTQDDVVLNMIFKDAIDPKIEYKDAFPQKKEIILYKHEINGLKSVDFIGKLNDDFMYPNQVKVETNNLPDCKIKPKNIYRFCVTKKDYKLMAYDKADGLVKERPLTIKFAAYVPPKENP